MGRPQHRPHRPPAGTGGPLAPRQCLRRRKDADRLLGGQSDRQPCGRAWSLRVSLALGFAHREDSTSTWSTDCCVFLLHGDGPVSKIFRVSVKKLPIWGKPLFIFPVWSCRQLWGCGRLQCCERAEAMEIREVRRSRDIEMSGAGWTGSRRGVFRQTCKNRCRLARTF